MNLPVIARKPIEQFVKGIRPFRFRIPKITIFNGLGSKIPFGITRNPPIEPPPPLIDWSSFAPRGSHSLEIDLPSDGVLFSSAPLLPDHSKTHPSQTKSGSNGSGKGPTTTGEGSDNGKPGNTPPFMPLMTVSDSDFPNIGWQFIVVGVTLSAIAALDIGTPRILLLLGSLFAFVPLAMSSVQSPLPILMALVVYIPYSKAIAGNMGGAVTGLNFTTVLMFIAIAAFLSMKKHDQILQPVMDFEKKFRLLVLFFCLMGAISVLHTDIAVASWSALTALVDYKRWIDPFLIFFFFSYLVRTEKDGRTIVYLMALSLVFIGIGSIWEHHALGELNHRVRLRGIAGQANQMGAFYANYSFLLLGFFFMKGFNLSKRVLFGFGILGCLLGLASTESRGDALALVFGIMVFLMLRNRILLLAFIGMIIFMFLNVQFLPQGLRARIQHTLTHKQTDEFSGDSTLDASARTRLALWTGAVRMIEDHPLFGVGYKMFPVYIYHYVPHTAETAHLELHNRDAHNAYLLIGAEMGLPTLFLFLVLLLNMFRISVRSYLASETLFWKTVSAAVICAIVSLVLTNMFGSRVISLVLAGYLWALLAILLKVPGWRTVETAKAVS